jgi:hypothetical protein
MATASNATRTRPSPRDTVSEIHTAPQIATTSASAAVSSRVVRALA